VLPDGVRPPAKRDQSGRLHQEGLCSPSAWRASYFAWQKPTSSGGDWIATTNASGVMQIAVGGRECPLSAVALSAADGLPRLRLQFDDCPRKAAVEVPLSQANSSESGVRVVGWMCTVAAGTTLCEDALRALRSTEFADMPGEQEVLDLGMLVKAASKGMRRMRARSECFGSASIEGLEWFVVDEYLGVAPEEWKLLTALLSLPLLAPKAPPQMHVPSELEVEVVCMQDCDGSMADGCSPRDYTTVKWLPGGSAVSLRVHSGLSALAGGLADEITRPWLLFLFAGCFLLGALAGLCSLACGRRPPEKRERRIKKVSVMYHEVPGESAFVSAATMR
jgi:hypothetical protein